MGGLGSGRQPYKYEYTVEDCLRINTGMMLHGKKLIPGMNASGNLFINIEGQKFSFLYYEISLRLKSPYIRLYYNWKKENIDYIVFLISTHPNYGGFRFWFICPSCEKRVWKLYLALRSKYFLCRQCQNLTYASCRKSHSDDTIIRDMSSKTGLSWEEAKQALFDLRRKYGRNEGATKVNILSE